MTRVGVFLIPLWLLASQPAPGCTIFVVSDSNTVMAGNNEDFYNPATKIWFLPRENGKHGRVYFGFDDRIRQGGMNDQGLFFDTVAAPRLDMPQLGDRRLYRGDLITKAMEECATVEEVTALFRKFGPFIDGTDPPSVGGAILFADKSGDSVIIEGDVQIPKEGRFQVATNFHQSRPELGGYPCERYTIANEMLAKSVDVSIDLCRRVLAATHLEHEAGFSNPTVYSNICDLKRGVIYFYHFHNFENVVRLDLKEELEKGAHEYDLPSLFPQTMAASVYESVRPRIVSDVLRRIIDEEGITAAIDSFHQLRDGTRDVPTHFSTARGLNSLGYELMEGGRLTEATEIFKLYVEAFPDDWNAYDSLGEAYMKSGKTDLAIRDYEKSVRLNPDNENARAMLRKLRDE
jgi:tetratricopeptide (TPR) repeat protein